MEDKMNGVYMKRLSILLITTGIIIFLIPILGGLLHSYNRQKILKELDNAFNSYSSDISSDNYNNNSINESSSETTNNSFITTLSS
jgi:ABC-type glycerol-3-phosphate transport system permease component